MLLMGVTPYQAPTYSKKKTEAYFISPQRGEKGFF